MSTHLARQLPPQAASHEILGLHVAGSDYGIDLHCVQALRHYSGFCQWDGGPCACGVLDDQGQFVPVIDLRGAVSCDCSHPPERHWVVVILSAGFRRFGVLVESVTTISDSIGRVPNQIANRELCSELRLIDPSMLYAKCIAQSGLPLR